jgi:heptosyltransferase-3
MKPIELVDRPRILVVVLRRLGDVLLTTPLIRSLKAGFPGCSVEALVFRGTEGMLVGNPDLDVVIPVSERPSFSETARTLWALWRRYDLAVATQTGDRPILYTCISGRRRIGFGNASDPGRWWKRRVLHGIVPVDNRNHRVVELLRIADFLALERKPEIVSPSPAETPSARGRYAVLHVNPKFRIRQWTDAGWRRLADGLVARGMTVQVTGGPDPEEKAYLDRVWHDMPNVVRLDGKLGWPQLVSLLRHAAVYVGPDTSMTHLSAAAGASTIALYGPESPATIGPWPAGGLDRPWSAAGTIQKRGNVWVVQNPLPCLPCSKLGCENHLNSYSRCLDELSVERVLEAVDEALAHSRGTAG